MHATGDLEQGRGTRATVVSIFCLVIFATLPGFTHSRSPTGFERRADCYGA